MRLSIRLFRKAPLFTQVILVIQLLERIVDSAQGSLLGIVDLTAGQYL